MSKYGTERLLFPFGCDAPPIAWPNSISGTPAFSHTVMTNRPVLHATVSGNGCQRHGERPRWNCSLLRAGVFLGGQWKQVVSYALCVILSTTAAINVVSHCTLRHWPVCAMDPSDGDHVTRLSDRQKSFEIIKHFKCHFKDEEVSVNHQNKYNIYKYMYMYRYACILCVYLLWEQHFVVLYFNIERILVPHHLPYPKQQEARDVRIGWENSR